MGNYRPSVPHGGPHRKQQHDKNVVVLRHNHDLNNLAAAKIIIADPDRYGGQESGLVRWSWIVLKRLQPQKNLWSAA